VAQTLEDFIREADLVYPSNLVLTQYQQSAFTNRPVEILAQYLVAEMRDLYGPTSSDHENLRRFISNLEFASARLEAVTRHLRERYDESLS
jgi:hypothetical protein